MMAAGSTTPNLNKNSSQGRSWRNPSGSPLLQSETGSNVAAHRRLKPSVREVNSRYLSTSTSLSSNCSSSSATSRRSASPIASGKRSQSAERRRPATPTPVKAPIGAQMSVASKALMSSRRSLSVSFQGESLVRPAPPANFQKATTESRRAAENARSVVQQPWPTRSRQTSNEKAMSKSVDLGSDRKKLIGGSGNLVRSVKQSVSDRIDQIPCQDKLQEINCGKIDVSANLLNLSNSGSKDNENMSQIRSGARGVIVPARFWEETNNRLRRLAEPSSSLFRSSSLKATVSPSPRVNLTSRGPSPLRNGVRPASPSRSSPSRAMASPRRVRNGVVGTSGNAMCSVPSVLCFVADVRRGKLGETRISDAYLLRLMYNRHLQWRFANCRVEAALSFQRLNAERNLYNAWKAMSDFRSSVSKWRLEFTRMSLKLKLYSILKEQMMYLEKWALLEKDFVSSLLGATESFRASTIQLPFVCGATADIPTLKGAICSAVDVLQAMASSICSLMSEVEKVNSLLDEVVNIATSEHAMLSECKEYLSALAAFQVKDCSLRAHISQMERAPPRSLSIEA